MDPTISNCNFCADNDDSAISIAELEPNFQNALAKYFWFQEAELFALQICSVCSGIVMDFHQLYTTVQRLHATKDNNLEHEENANEEVIVKNEPLDSELISGDYANGEQLIVGDVAFEIVDVSAKTEFVENENELPDEVKHEIADALINKKQTVHCLNCEKSFEDKMVLELHMKMVHGDQTAVRRCSQCALLEQALREALQQDIAEVPESSERVQCAICDGKLKNVASLQRHLTWHWGEICSICRRRPNDYEPISEEQEDDPCESFVCTDCDNKFSNYYTFKRHMCVHKVHETAQEKKKIPYACEYCNKPYTRLKHLKTHMDKHHQFASGECRKCQVLDQALEELSQRSESGESGRVKCDVCDSWLVNMASYQRHLTWHQSSPCEVCQRVQALNMPNTRIQPPAKKPKMDEVSITSIGNGVKEELND